ncbi:DUF2314 domain-containing protein [Rhizobium sp. TH2]|uniref:hypothetical protein n=1 Tax=Rhizobium sp. TH2 TaxID=2775403 RepID=UPI0021588DD6|nr:hypothetical protein [Rhizobium sp. TH2]UVC08741.1 DUF2314 domain-containing protein [Rhizobium sp. TH2]
MQALVIREPDFNLDGWCLDDGEEINREYPDTFWIPDRKDREGLQPGDFAKLIFRISVENDEEPVVVERMWVVVSKRLPGGYLGILDNDPDSIAENDSLWSGVEIPFQAHHVINIEAPDEQSVALAASEPRTRWPNT